MRPIRVSVEVPQGREEVFEWLDVNAHHARLLEHMWSDFEFSGPERGVGAKLRARSRMPGPEDWSEIEVVQSEPPRLIAEQGTGGKGRRRTQGTYVLEEHAGGGTDSSFELKVQRLPVYEKPLAPLMRAYLRRSMRTAMDRLRDELAHVAPSAPSPPAP